MHAHRSTIRFQVTTDHHHPMSFGDLCSSRRPLSQPCPYGVCTSAKVLFVRAQSMRCGGKKKNNVRREEYYSVRPNLEYITEQKNPASFTSTIDRYVDETQQKNTPRPQNITTKRGGKYLTALDVLYIPTRRRVHWPAEYRRCYWSKIDAWHE